MVDCIGDLIIGTIRNYGCIGRRSAQTGKERGKRVYCIGRGSAGSAQTEKGCCIASDIIKEFPNGRGSAQTAFGNSLIMSAAMQHPFSV